MQACPRLSPLACGCWQRKVVDLKRHRPLLHRAPILQCTRGLGAVLACIPLLAPALLARRLAARGNAGAVGRAVAGAVKLADGECVVKRGIIAHLQAGGGAGREGGKGTNLLERCADLPVRQSFKLSWPEAHSRRKHVRGKGATIPPAPVCFPPVLLLTTPANHTPSRHCGSEGSSTTISELSRVAAFQRGRRSYCRGPHPAAPGERGTPVWGAGGRAGGRAGRQAAGHSVRQAAQHPGSLLLPC